jgi:hypothetical protein
VSEVAAPTADAPVAVPEVAAAESAPVAAPETPVSGEATVSAPIPEGAPAPTRADDPWPEVEWGEWDGEIESLPEQYHKTASGMRNWYHNAMSGREDEIESLRSMYAAMLTGEEDPRVGELTGKLEALQAQHDSQTGEFNGLKEAFQNNETKMVTDYVDRFWKDHAELKEDSAKLDKFTNFLEEENEFGGMWDGYIAAELVNLPEEALQIAVQAKKDGVADEYALKLAQANAQLNEAKATPSPEEIKAAHAEAKAVAEAKQPRTGAKITNGATRSSRPRMAKQGMGDAKSLDDLRLLASRRAFAVHGGGRK